MKRNSTIIDYSRIVLFLLFYQLISLSTAVYAGSAGTKPAAFLKLDINARPSAMGGTFVGIADDVNSLSYNPAGLGNIQNHQVTFMHNAHFQKVNQEYLGFVHSKGWGAGINFLDWGKIKRTTLLAPSGGIGSYEILKKVLAKIGNLDYT